MRLLLVLLVALSPCSQQAAAQGTGEVVVGSAEQLVAALAAETTQRVLLAGERLR